MLAAAKELFTLSAFDHVKAADIARAAGVAHGLVFHHFGSKWELYQEVLREFGREVLELHVTDPAVPLGRRMRQSLRAHLDYLAAHRNVAVNLILRGPGPGAEQFDEIRDQATRRLCDTLGLDVERPAVRMVVRAYTTAADQIARDHLTGNYPLDVDDVVEMMITLLIGALHSAERVDPELDTTTTSQALELP